MIIIFIILIILSGSIVFFAKESQKDKLQELRHKIIDDFNQALAYEKADLLSFSLALSENGSLKNAILADNDSQAYEILSGITKRFKSYTHIKSLRIQLLDNDFFIFAQSWGNASAGLPLWWFRDDLKQLKENQRPKVGIETGRRLTFKATIPIQNGRENIGYLEVIKFIDEFANKLHQQGIELFALMQRRYLKQASLMQEFPFLGEYIIANKNYNIQLYTQTKSLEWQKLNTQGYLYTKGILYILESMYNGKHEEIGKYLIILPKATLEQYQRRYQDISLITRLSDKDIYQVVQRWEYPAGSFKTTQDRKLIEWIPKLHPEDRAQLIPKAKAMLQTYRKDELIDIILHNKHQEPKQGVVQ